jgi:hypothetical protein
VNLEWAAWGPTIVSIVTCIFFAGVLWSNQNDHAKRLDNHDELHKETQDHDSKQDIALAKLEAWKDGYGAARAVYDKLTSNLQRRKEEQ